MKLRLALNKLFSGTDTSIWTIKTVTSKDRGYYSCEVISDAGNHTAITYLDTKEPPPHIIDARNQSAIVRETAFLHCKTQSNENPRILWERNGVVVGNSAKVVSCILYYHKIEYLQYQYSNGTLRILDASRRDSGMYTCRATTSGGSDEARIFLSVYEMPTISVTPSILYVARSRSFTLTCTVGGDPIPTLIWMFNGAPVVPDRNHYFSQNSKSNIKI